MTDLNLYYLTTSLLGAGLAVLILVLVRLGHLHLSHGLFWIGVALSAAVLGFWPHLIDQLAVMAGIHYPPSFLLLSSMILLLIKALFADMANSRLERQIRRLNQRVCLIETHSSDKIKS